MFGTPAFDSPLTYLGVLLLTVGVYLTLSGFGILRIEKYSTPESVKSWGMGLILILTGLALLFVLPTIQLPTNESQQEVSILSCQNDPNLGIVRADTEVVLTWGWSGFDSDSKRDELVSIISFIVEVDGTAQDSNDFRIVYRRDSVIWTINIGKLGTGFHTVRLTRILAQDYMDSSGLISAGRQPPEICELTVQ